MTGDASIKIRLSPKSTISDSCIYLCKKTEYLSKNSPENPINKGANGNTIKIVTNKTLSTTILVDGIMEDTIGCHSRYGRRLK